MTLAIIEDKASCYYYICLSFIVTDPDSVNGSSALIKASIGLASASSFIRFSRATKGLI